MIIRINFLCLIFVLLSISAPTSISSNYLWQQKHRIRHYRHLSQKQQSPQNDRLTNGECIVKPWSNSLQSKAGCPRDKCMEHMNCWQEFGRTKICVCDPHLCGRVCIDYDQRCGFPEHPKYGKAIFNDLRVGDEVRYSCEPGYAVKGPRKRFCQANLKLSGPEPECTDQTDLCFSPPYIPNSVVIEGGSSRNDYRNGETVKFSCQKGFEDRTNAYMVATCVGNEWRYSPLKCQRISCGPLKDHYNGRVMYMDSYTYQSVAIPFCNDGFRLHCDQFNSLDDKPCKRICEADGRWSGSEAICKPILCPNLKAPLNGRMEGVSNKVNNIRRFSCNEGYQLVGSYIRNCQLNGEWDGWPASCKIRDCGRPAAVPFSSLIFEKTSYGSKAEYKCLGGTTLIGESAVLTCREANNSSVWLPQPPPQCVKHCTPLHLTNANISIINTKNQHINTDIDFYTLIPHNTQINITCSHGYQLNKINFIPKCNNGSYNFIPKCVEASCSKRPDAESNSLVRFYSLSHNALAQYYCHYGYRVINKMNPGKASYSTFYEKRCIKGQWVRFTKGLCVPTKCDMPETPDHGKVFLKGQGDRTELTGDNIRINHGRIIEYECMPDYRLSSRGAKIAVCINGEWSPPEVPRCDFIMHDELPLQWLFYDTSSASKH